MTAIFASMLEILLQSSTFPHRCSRCKTWRGKESFKLLVPFNKEYGDTCKPCKNEQKAAQQAYRAKKAKYRDYVNQKKRQAMPPWLTRKQLREIWALYRLRDKLSAKTGIQYTVDHIIPLRANDYLPDGTCIEASGLHVPWNLQIMPIGPNKRKGSTFLHELVDPDE